MYVLKLSNGDFKMKEKFIIDQKATKAKEENQRIQITYAQDGPLIFDLSGEEFKFDNSVIKTSYEKLYFKVLFENKE